MGKTKKAAAETPEISETPSDAVSKAPRAVSWADAPGTPAVWVSYLRSRITTDQAALLVVFAVGFLLFIPALGSVGLWDPWETHYAEVAREMIVRDDFVYPYWESTYFFSKPALPMWLMALGMTLVGAEGGPPGAPLGSLVEWGVRLPFAIIAIFTLWAVYEIGRRARDRVTGLLAMFVLASSAQFIFIGKQAMADMPLVGFMTIGLALFVGAVFDEEPNAPATNRQKAFAGLGIALALFPQLVMIGRELEDVRGIGLVLLAFGLGVAAIAGLVLKGTRRDCYLAGFYVCLGLAALAKGLAVLAVVGPAVLLYALISRDWAVLSRSRFILGGMLFLLVGVPWYLTMSLFDGRDEEGKTFVQRFWLHDNFGRVGQGVHGDRGGLGYFVEQLAYAMFPWVAFLPFSIGLAVKGRDDETSVAKKRVVLFVAIWAIATFTFFSISQTKFHHYIFPAVPALAILVGYWLSWVGEDPGRRMSTFIAVPVLGVFAIAARDLVNDPQNLVNLFTYKYDRDYPREINPRVFLAVLFSLGGVAFALFHPWPDGLGAKTDPARKSAGKAFLLWSRGWLVARGWHQRGYEMMAMGLVALVFGAWISHHHFNMLSPHWSQYHLFDTYYAEKTGNEPIYAYQLNWRGETFYSRNTILQVKEAGANERIRELVDRPGREFIITEQSRFHTLKGVLSKDKQDKIEIIDQSSNKFYLCVVND